MAAATPSEPENNQDPTIDPVLTQRIQNLESQITTLHLLVHKVAGEDAETSKKKEANPLDNWDKVVKVVSGILAAIVGAAAVFYAIGFVIVNLHLSNFNVRDFELIKPSYLTAGIVFLTYVVIIILAGIGFTFTRQRISRPNLNNKISDVGYFRFIGPLVDIALLASTQVAIINILIDPASVVDSQGSDEPPLTYGFMFIGLLMTGLFLTVKFGIERLRSKEKEAGDIWMNLALFLLLLLITIPTWGLTVYPLTSSAFGGGQPLKVQLVIADDSTDSTKNKLFEEIGIEVKNGVTDPINLLDETSQTLIVVLDNGNAAKVDRKLIANILYLSQSSGTTPANSSTSPPITPTSAPP